MILQVSTQFEDEQNETLITVNKYLMGISTIQDIVSG